VSGHPKPHRRSAAGLLALGVGLLLAQAGCVSAKYKSSSKDTPPAVPLNLTARPDSDPDKKAAAEITLQAVIVFRGPGSWKRDAYWDEYVLKIMNRGSAPLNVDSAILTDFQNQSVVPGQEPWELERQSRSYEKRLLSTSGYALAVGSGAVASTMGGLLGGAWVASMAGASAGSIAALPVFVGATIYRNVSGKHHINDQFNSRRLALPLTLAPGQATQGSLFFRISPGPQRLALHSTGAGEESRDDFIDLAPLAGLHRKTSEAAKPSPQ
jgi:hypothetical protein